MENDILFESYMDIVSSVMEMSEDMSTVTEAVDINTKVKSMVAKLKTVKDKIVAWFKKLYNHIKTKMSEFRYGRNDGKGVNDVHPNAQIPAGFDFKKGMVEVLSVTNMIYGGCNDIHDLITKINVDTLRKKITFRGDTPTLPDELKILQADSVEVITSFKYNKDNLPSIDKKLLKGFFGDNNTMVEIENHKKLVPIKNIDSETDKVISKLKEIENYNIKLLDEAIKKIDKDLSKNISAAHDPFTDMLDPRKDGKISIIHHIYSKLANTMVSSLAIIPRIISSITSAMLKAGKYQNMINGYLSKNTGAAHKEVKPNNTETRVTVQESYDEDIEDIVTMVMETKLEQSIFDDELGIEIIHEATVTGEKIKILINKLIIFGQKCAAFFKKLIQSIGTVINDIAPKNINGVNIYGMPMMYKTNNVSKGSDYMSNVIEDVKTKITELVNIDIENVAHINKYVGLSPASLVLPRELENTNEFRDKLFNTIHGDGEKIKSEFLSLSKLGTTIASMKDLMSTNIRTSLHHLEKEFKSINDFVDKSIKLITSKLKSIKKPSTETVQFVNVVMKCISLLLSISSASVSLLRPTYNNLLQLQRFFSNPKTKEELSKQDYDKYKGAKKNEKEMKKKQKVNESLFLMALKSN